MGELASIGSSALRAIASVIFTGLSGRFDPMVTNTGKCIVATVFFALTLLALGDLGTVATVSPASLGWLALSAVVGLAIGDTAYFRSLTRIGPRRTLLIMALVPPMTATVGVLVLDDPFTGAMLLGMAVTLAGVAWVIRERAPNVRADYIDPATMREGVALSVVASIGQTGGIILTKLAAADLSALTLSGVRLAFAAVVLVGMCLASGRAHRLVVLFTGPGLPRLLLATSLGTYGGIWLMNIGILGSPVGVASTLQSLSPIFILPLAWYWQREHVSPRAVVGAVIATLGVALLFLLR